MFATTFKPENPQEISPPMQKTSSLVKSDDKSKDKSPPPISKDNTSQGIKLTEEQITISSYQALKEKKKDQIERILAKYVLSEKRVKSTRQFRKYVQSHEYPVITLYRKKNSQQCQQIEISLKKELIKSKGKFRLCIMDQNLVDEKLKKDQNFTVAPSIYMYYRGSLVQEHWGVPSRQVLKTFMKTVQSFHYIATEEIVVSSLLEKGQEFINEQKWIEAVNVFEEAEKMERWNEIYGDKIYSSLSLIYAQIGDLTKAKHFMQLYREKYQDFGHQIGVDEEELQNISKATQIIMSHFTINQQQALTNLAHETLDDFSLTSSDHDSAHILFSEQLFDAYYYSDEDETQNPNPTNQTLPTSSKERIKMAEDLINKFEYQDGLNICLKSLEVDYNDIEAHRLILETFNALGFRNQLTLKTKEALKEIMLKSQQV